MTPNNLRVIKAALEKATSRAQIRLSEQVYDPERTTAARYTERAIDDYAVALEIINRALNKE